MLVLAEHLLIGETVRAALADRGFAVSTGAVGGRLTPPVRRTEVDVLLLLWDLDTPAEVAVARAVVGSSPVRTVVMTATPPGPAWGGVLESGATAVLLAGTTLDQVVEVLDAVHRGEDVMDAGLAARLQRAWQEMSGSRVRLLDRMATLTRREREVLRLMQDGLEPDRMAQRLARPEAVVRQLVAEVLAKLELDTPLAAVAALHDLERSVPADPEDSLGS